MKVFAWIIIAVLGTLSQGLQAAAVSVPLWYQPHGTVNAVRKVFISKRQTWGKLFPSQPDMLRHLEISMELTLIGYEEDFSKKLIVRVIRPSKEVQNPSYRMEFARAVSSPATAFFGLAVAPELTYEETIRIQVPLTEGGIGRYSDKERTVTLKFPGYYDAKIGPNQFHVQTAFLQGKNAVKTPVVQRVALP